MKNVVGEVAQVQRLTRLPARVGRSARGVEAAPDSGPIQSTVDRRVSWKLTSRQAQVLALVARGATNGTIAEELGITERTVEYHLSAIFDRVGVDNRATLIARLLAP